MKMFPWTIKRKKPFTEAGILRKKCIRCDGKAFFQWQICSDDNNWRPLCKKCDIALQKVVLKFMKHPECDRLVEEYKQHVEQ